MRLPRWTLLPSLCAVLVLAGAVGAETTVELKGVHLCCKGCENAVLKTVQGVEGAKAVCDRKGKTVTITAPDDATARKALDALAAAGFHGETGNAKLAMKNDSGVAKGKVKSLTVTGVHNCCPSCCRALKATVKKVEGVSEDTIKPKEKTFEVTGDFDAAELVKALNAAGFHAKVKK